MEDFRIRINKKEYPGRYTMEAAIEAARDIAINKRRAAFLFIMCDTGEYVHVGTYQPHVDGFITYTDARKEEHQIPCCEAYPVIPQLATV